MTWQRLDQRMLLVHPVGELIRFWPALLGLLVAGSTTGGGPWGLLAVTVPIALGIVRYLSTTWRITDERVEVRRGVLRRQTLSAPLDRVRTVDLSAPPVHRLLGLARIDVGTGRAGGDDDGLSLDALRREDAAAMRERLLARVAARSAVASAPPAGHDPGQAPAPPPPPPPPPAVVARFSPGWVRFAPFSGTALLAAGALAGGAAQLVSELRLDVGERTLDRIDSLSIVVGVAVGLVGVVLIIGIAVVAYLIVNGGFTLTRDGRSWHVARGLLTHRETSIDVERLAGVSMPQPALLRLARGGRVDALVTGLGSDVSTGSGALLPPAPAALATRTATAVIGDATPVVGPLRSHGPAARTRRFTRAAVGASPLAAATVAAVVLGAPGVLLLLLVPLALAVVALAADRWRGLGHGDLAGHVVMRSGSLTRRRDILGHGHVIGWTTRATWFQRRVGLLTLTATTAAGGSGAITVPDIPGDDAVALALVATPGLLDPFLAGTTPQPVPDLGGTP